MASRRSEQITLEHAAEIAVTNILNGLEQSSWAEKWGDVLGQNALTDLEEYRADIQREIIEVFKGKEIVE